jgi:hypothetical protein
VIEQLFPLSVARALLPELRARSEDFTAARADLAELMMAMRTATPSRLGGLPEAKAYEARMHEFLEWLQHQGIHVKGLAPLLLDFPSELDGRPVLLCWLEGESELAWYHDAELGFQARRPLPRD